MSPPIYIPAFDDTLRMGTFVHVRLPNQDPITTTVGRLEQFENGEVKIQLYYPLFPKKNLKCHPPVPLHANHPIVDGPGSGCIELYQSYDLLSSKDPKYAKFCIMFPAFV